MMKKAVIFDLNGVLIKSEYLSQRFEDVHGVPNATFVAALKEVMDVVRRPSAPSVHSQFEPYFKEWGVELSEEEFLQFWFSGESVDEEALAYIESLVASGTMVFVVSNNFRERTTYYREQFGQIFTHLTKAYFSWETGLVKPSKGPFELVLQEHNLKPEAVVFFDDSATNIEIANGLGIDAHEWQGIDHAKTYLSSL